MAVCGLATAQPRDYFQQEAHYKIEVSLNDVSHRLNGKLQLRYVNHSPDTLRFIYFHLWANAYKNNQTEFAKQQLANGSLSFYFAKKADRGYMDSLDFSSNGEQLKWQLNEDSIDIAKVILATPLVPGASVDIATPFVVQLPKTVSRLGHEGQSYQITQWYPKPAVYDREGWHTMPYLDQGEFYSEFGSFDVSITLPSNYVVASTGVLQTESEKQFLQKRIEETAQKVFGEEEYKKVKKHEFPPSDSLRKTLRFTAEQVHDFAWFADKRFHVRSQKATLPSGKQIDCYAYFTDFEAHLWAEGARYTAQAVEFYSQTVGEYPYPHASAVQGALGAGGGMEYPMVTVIGGAGSSYGLDIVIAHEVGHNWFYGILATNERDYPWLDEGFNSYVEARYTEKYYKSPALRTGYLAYLYQAHRGAEQPINTHSNLSTNINYYLGAYAKPTQILYQLHNYLGTERMDKALQGYFELWKFKHPQPDDVERVFEEVAGEQLDWFFKDLVNTIGRVDYGWCRCQQGQCMVEQRGEIAAPIDIGVYNEKDSLLQRLWISGNSLRSRGDKIELAELPPAHYYRLDPLRSIPEYNRNDNLLRSKGIFRRGIPLRVRLLANFRRPEHPTLCLLPLVGYNHYDGVTVGLAAYNMPLPQRDWQVQAMPMFGTRSLSPIGAFSFQRQITPLNSRFLEQLTITAGVRSFTAAYNPRFDYFARYMRIRLVADMELAKRNPKDFGTHRLRFEHASIGEEKPEFDIQPDTVLFAGKPMQFRSLHRLEYLYTDTRPLCPMRIKAGIEYANYKSFGEYQHQLKISAEANFRFMYSARFGVDMRVFAGGFLWNTDRSGGAMPLQLISRGFTDYFYDNYWVERNANVQVGRDRSFWSQQIGLGGGGIKAAIGDHTDDGHSNTFIFAVNLKADIPIKLPIRTKWVKLRPYLDLGYFYNTESSFTPQSPAEQIMASGGFMLDIGDGLAGLYIPLFATKNLMQKMRAEGKFGHRICFSINFNALNPVEFVRRIEF